jgi:hypothetical protein
MTQINITIFSSFKRLFIGFDVTNFSVVADHKIVAKTVIFLNFFTLNGCTNLIGMNVNIKKNIIIPTFTHPLIHWSDPKI